MARSLRIEFAGAIYHVTTRGNDRCPIFLDDKDRHHFIQKLGENTETHAIRLYAYVLMSNHYHLLIETPRANLSSFMHQLNTGYVAYHNTRHQRCGHLFEGRYKAKLVEGDRYLLSLVRYIHLNPIKVRLHAEDSASEKLSALRNYPWSSHLAYCGVTNRESHVDYEPLLSLVAAQAENPEKVFQQYVESGLPNMDSELKEAQSRSSKAIGCKGFCLWVESRCRKHAEDVGQKLDASMRRIEVEVTPKTVISCICGHYCLDEGCLTKKRNTHISRVIAMKLLKECSGLNHRSIAALLGMRDGSGVSRWITYLNLRMAEDREIFQVYEELRERVLNH